MRHRKKKKKESVLYNYNGMLFSHEKEGNPVIRDSMDR